MVMRLKAFSQAVHVIYTICQLAVVLLMESLNFQLELLIWNFFMTLSWKMDVSISHILLSARSILRNKVKENTNKIFVNFVKFLKNGLPWVQVLIYIL